MANCMGLLGFCGQLCGWVRWVFVVERKREDVRRKLINKLTMLGLDVKNKRINVGKVMKLCAKIDKVSF